MLWSPHYDRLKRRIEKRQIKDPEDEELTAGERAAFVDRPLLLESQQWVWEAFFMLSHRRGYISGLAAFPAPITLEAIDCLARRLSIETGEPYMDFFSKMDAMDQAYIKAQVKAQAKK